MTYNVEFDYTMLTQTAKRYGLKFPILAWHDLMTVYAHYYGKQFSPTEFTWVKLTTACSHMGIEVGNAHRALDDAHLALALLKALAAKA